MQLEGTKDHVGDDRDAVQSPTISEGSKMSKVSKGCNATGQQHSSTETAQQRAAARRRQLHTSQRLRRGAPGPTALVGFY